VSTSAGAPPAVAAAPPVVAAEPSVAPSPAPDAQESSLTADQRAAIEAPPMGRLKIVAGAGSGKTEVLTRRIAALLEQGVPPRDLVAVTYTRKAAAELKQRLVAKRGLSPRLFHEMQVNTFHGFLGWLLRRDPFAAGLDGSDATVAETARQLLLEEVREAFEAAFAERLTSSAEGFDPPEAQALVREFPRALGRIRRFLLGPADFQAEVRRAAAARGVPLTATEQRVLDWLHRFYAMYLNALQERHLMDFDEILLRGEALVREWQETGSGAGPRVFLIDEFQDNNREQLRIVERILAGRDGHLTVVGDFRQSIYRFQGAEVSTFVDFRGTREIVLRENFRSCQEVVELANAAIAPGLPAGLPAEQREQISHLGPSARPQPVACLLTGSENPRDQAAAIAELIKRLVAGGLRVVKTGRPLAFGDVAVIVPSIRRLPASFEDAFLERGVPYQMTGGLGFYDRCEIAELVAFLRLLVNPYHDHSLVKILSGPLFGLTDAELADLALDEPPDLADEPIAPSAGAEKGMVREGRRSAGRKTSDGEREPLWVRLERRRRQAPERLPERAHRFARFFAELRTCSLTMGVLDLVYHLIEEAGFREYAAAQANDLRRRRLENNLAKFIAVVRGFEQSGVFTTLRDFLAWHDRVLGSDIEEEEAGLGLDDRGAVKIMTIHKAKGLEFPLVILPDLKRRPYRADHRIGFSREEGLLVRPAKGTAAHPPWETYQEREKAATEAEDLRKLYVAFTRAEELLVVTGHERRSVDSQEPLAFVRSWIEAHPTAGQIRDLEDVSGLAEAWLTAGACPAAEAPAAPVPPDLPALVAALAAVRTFLEQPAPAVKRRQGREEVFSLADLERYEQCPRRYFFGRQHLAPLVSPAPVPREVGWFFPPVDETGRAEPSAPAGGPMSAAPSHAPSAREVAACVGNLVHQTLRLFHQPRGDSANRPSVTALLERLVPLHGAVGQLARPRAAALLEAYARSPLAVATAWLVEAEVNLRLVAPSGPFLVRGFIDRVDRDGPHTRLIDYKTHPFHAEAHALYARQMALYLAAARHGILGDRGVLSFPEACVAYLTPQGVDLRPVDPDTVQFEAWAITLVEAIRREKTWPPGLVAPCADCGFLVLCQKPETGQAPR
jgi:DNA helicase-2/ATP-dependent DNA helicase PcrA